MTKKKKMQLYLDIAEEVFNNRRRKNSLCYILSEKGFENTYGFNNGFSLREPCNCKELLAFTIDFNNLHFFNKHNNKSRIWSALFAVELTRTNTKVF